MSDSTPADTSPTIGQRLMAARERLGHSVATAAEKTRLDASVIAGLESDRFDSLGPPVYVRGHLRMYAEFLELPSADLLVEYQQHETASRRPDLTRIAKAERPSDPRKLRGPVLAALLAVALAAAAWWLLRKPPVPTESEAPPATPDRVVPLEPVGGANPEVATIAPQAGEIVAVAQAMSPKTEASLAAAASLELRVSLTADSWIEVYDSSGRRLYYDLGTRGSVQSFRGPGPMRVVLGNAAAATLAVDGRDVAIPATATRGRLARLLIGPGRITAQSR
ncbi:MAG: DUF4115 domain-containing protein [Pseudomonadales bacterium]|nr:DUF4115 domain-containing protein [Pseudomonadales bacterium]